MKGDTNALAKAEFGRFSHDDFRRPVECDYIDVAPQERIDRLSASRNAGVVPVMAGGAVTFEPLIRPAIGKDMGLPMAGIRTRQTRDQAGPIAESLDACRKTRDCFVYRSRLLNSFCFQKDVNDLSISHRQHRTISRLNKSITAV